MLSYHGETGIVSGRAVSHHLDEKVRRLADQPVKVLPETAEWFICKGVKKIKVGVIPLNLPNPEQIIISLDFIKSSDPTVNGLRKR